MNNVNAKEVGYTILMKADNPQTAPYPYLRDANGDKAMCSLNPSHGRSFVIGKTQNNYIVSKGNGLSYTQYSFIHTQEYGDNTWGLLLQRDAIRDFLLGEEISQLGIKTNRMEYVLQLNAEVLLPNGKCVRPVLLQHLVECPYRLTDFSSAIFQQVIVPEVERWEQYNAKGHRKKHLVAAEVLVGNLQTLHGNGILHNAIHPQNDTWALELVDFELGCSPKYPYDNEEDRRLKDDLFAREWIYTYQIISHIAMVLDEDMNHQELEQIFRAHGCDLSELQAQLDAK